MNKLFVTFTAKSAKQKRQECRLLAVRLWLVAFLLATLFHLMTSKNHD